MVPTGWESQRDREDLRRPVSIERKDIGRNTRFLAALRNDSGDGITVFALPGREISRFARNDRKKNRRK
jgi:hypothetical protein